MSRTATSDHMRRLDRLAESEYGIPTLLLMENAGRGAADAIESLLEGRDRPVAVVCGKGNNGGDGFVIARHLHNRGYPVVVHLVAEASAISPASDAGVNLSILAKMRVPILPLPIAPDAQLVVDALLGTGLSGPVRPPFDAAIRAVNAHGAPVAAVDVPSGLDADDGRVLGVAVRAVLTATFGLVKRGLTTGEGPAHAGRVVLVDISIPRELLEAESP